MALRSKASATSLPFASPRSHSPSRSVRYGITTSVDNGTITPLRANVRAASGHPVIHGPSNAISVVINAQAVIHATPSIRITTKPAAFRRFIL